MWKAVISKCSSYRAFTDCLVLLWDVSVWDPCPEVTESLEAAIFSGGTYGGVELLHLLHLLHLPMCSRSAA